MPLPVLGFAAVFSIAALPIATKILAGLGVGIVTYVGVTSGLDFAFEFIQTQYSGLPTEVAAMFGLAQVDAYVTMVFSAYTAKAAIAGISAGGALSKFRVLGLGDS